MTSQRGSSDPQTVTKVARSRDACHGVYPETVRLRALVILLATFGCLERNVDRTPERAARATGVQPNLEPEGCRLRATAVVAGNAHACALMTDGTVRCWGANYRGQLGDGTTTFRSAPVRVEGLRDVQAITAGDRHTCALRRDGTVWCWGANDLGQLGRAGAGRRTRLGWSEDYSARPAAVKGLGRVAAIAAGATYGLALSEGGAVELWGQMGFPMDGPDVHEPFRLSTSGVNQIAARDGIACALGRDGAACWGPDVYRIAGRQTAGPFELVSLDEAAAWDPVSIGMDFVCGVDAVGRARCSGQPASLGQAASPARFKTYDRDVLVEGLSDVTTLSARWQTCAVIRDGRVACWGRDTFAALRPSPDRPPAGTYGRRSEPVLRRRPVWIAGLADAIQVAVGPSSVCAVTRSGRVRCWGENGYGQLGDATTEASEEPTEVRFCAETSTPVFPPVPEGASLIAAIQRDACLGPCPLYSLRIFDDGTVIYRGEGNVLVRGGRTARLSSDQVQELRRTFQRANFLGLTYQCGGAVTDSPTVRIFYAEGGRARLISDYLGCKKRPSVLGPLEEDVDRIAGSGRWVGRVDVPLWDDFGAEGPLTVPGVALEPLD